MITVLTLSFVVSIFLLRFKKNISTSFYTPDIKGWRFTGLEDDLHVQIYKTIFTPTKNVHKLEIRAIAFNTERQ